MHCNGPSLHGSLVNRSGGRLVHLRTRLDEPSICICSGKPEELSTLLRAPARGAHANILRCNDYVPNTASPCPILRKGQPGLAKDARGSCHEQVRSIKSPNWVS